jgi:hypothetical protein
MGELHTLGSWLPFFLKNVFSTEGQPRPQFKILQLSFLPSEGGIKLRASLNKEFSNWLCFSRTRDSMIALSDCCGRNSEITFEMRICETRIY